MSNIVQITLNQKIDRKYIDDCITNAIPIDIELLQFFSTDLDAASVVSINSMTAPQLEAFKVLVDQLTFSLEATAIVWNIELVAKTFYLAKSYIRTTENTTTTPDDIVDGSPIIARFEIPGFEVNPTFDLTLWYNQSFSPTEVADLASQLGITVTGTGLSFIIANDTACKVSFIKPDVITDKYVINSDASNIIIPI